MGLFDEYNRLQDKQWKHRHVDKTWVLTHTANYETGVAVFWNEISNTLACFSQAWPHSGWKDFGDKICWEHMPWDMIDVQGEGWHFIGEL